MTGLRTTLVLLVVLMAPARPGRAAVQKSDLFVKTAMAMARYLLTSEMKEACAAGDHQALCEELVDQIALFAQDAVDGTLDSAATLARFEALGRRGLLAVAVDQTSRWIAENIPSAAGRPLPESSTADFRRIVRPVSRCLARAIVGRRGQRTECAEVEDEVKRTGSAARCPRTDGGATQALCVLRAAIGAIASPTGADPTVTRALRTFQTQARFAVRLLEDMYAAASEGTALFPRVVAALDDGVQPREQRILGTVSSHAVFDGEAVAGALAALQAAPGASCPDRARLNADLERFQGRRQASYLAYARAVSSGEPFDAIAAELRIPSADSLAPCRGLQAESKYLEWRQHADVFRFEASLHRSLRAVELPALLAALVLDAPRDKDAALTPKRLRSLVTRVIERAVAHRARRAFECAPPPDASPGTAPSLTTACRPFTSDPSTPSQAIVVEVSNDWQGTAVSSADFQRLLAEQVGARADVGAAQRNCAVQLLAAALEDRPVLMTEPWGALCWLEDRLESDRALSYLVKAASLELKPLQDASDIHVYRWDDAGLDIAAPGSRRLKLAGDSGRLAAAVIGHLSHASAPAGLANVLARIAPAVTAEPAEATSVALRHGAAALGTSVEAFIQEMVPAKECDANPTSQGCLVQAVTLAFFGPFVDVASGATSREELVVEVYRKVQELDPLSRSPFLFDLGLAYTGVSADSMPAPGTQRKTSHHLTVLDKWGLVLRGGQRHQFHAGVFAGGFVDAIVRSAGGEDQKEVHWLLGATVGVRQMARSIPIGIDLHAAWAPPLDLTASLDAWGFGAALLVPVDLVFD